MPNSFHIISYAEPHGPLAAKYQFLQPLMIFFIYKHLPHFQNSTFRDMLFYPNVPIFIVCTANIIYIHNI